MMNETGKRIKALRNSRGMTQQQVADLVDAKSQTTIAHWESGKNSPQGKDLRILSEYFKVSTDSILGIEHLHIPEPDDWDYEFYPMPVSAGELATIEAVASERIKMPDTIMGKYAGNDDVFFLRVNGQSMNKIIPHDSLIAVKKIEIEELNNDDIVVFSNGHEYSVKRFYNDKENQRLIFKSESTDRGFIDHPIDYSRTDELVIHGRVVLYIVSP